MKKILLVEDDKFLVKIYQNALTKQGYEVQLLGNGVQVQEKIKNFQPDLVLLDLVMPEVDGFETLARMRQDEATKNQPVIVLSALESDSDVNKVKNLGVKNYFLKSNTNFNQVIEYINNYLKP